MLVIGVVVVVVAVWWLTLTSTLFHVSVRDGKVLVVRGRVPVSLLQAFAEAVADPVVKRGSIKASKTETGGQLWCTGDIGEGREQRMRNAFMLYPASQLRHAPVIEKPTLGQLSGIAWLAWFLERR
ncbi:MAG: hypothetical protein JWO36_5278 [Myxococcales bacterium]|nr:hypothetical protein [Myxococcales bacterium]